MPSRLTCLVYFIFFYFCIYFQGGQLAAINLESRAALLAAKQVIIDDVQKSCESMELVRARINS